MWEYTDKVKEHFLNPRNVGEIENPDGVAEVGSLACGDALKLTFKLDENKKINLNPAFCNPPAQPGEGMLHKTREVALSSASRDIPRCITHGIIQLTNITALCL